MPKPPTDPALAEQARQTLDAFSEAFGRPATRLAAAPGRVNLIGEHTDYNGGLVLPMAIERWSCLAARPRDDKSLRIRSTALPGEAIIDLTQPSRPGEPAWANYPLGVVARWIDQQGPLAQGIEVLVDSSVPAGGGLSSSASIGVATATLLGAVTGKPMPPRDAALAAQWAEHTFAGMPCGLMDQLAVALAQPGHAMRIDFSDESVEHVPLGEELAVIITHCNQPHALVGGAYAERRRQCEAAAKKLGVGLLSEADPALLGERVLSLLPVERQRAVHVLEENARVRRFAAALSAGDWPSAGACMYESHESMRDLFEITTPELDRLVELAQAIGPGGGVIGARMTGGGFGGCTVTLAEAAQAESVCRRLAEDYKQATGTTTQPFITRPAGGAQPLNPASI